MVGCDTDDSIRSDMKRKPRDTLYNTGMSTEHCEHPRRRRTFSSSSTGNIPILTALCTIAGTHSCLFHAPLGPPESWPVRMIVGLNVEDSVDALARMLSPTHFDCAYPFPEAHSAGTRASQRSTSGGASVQSALEGNRPVVQVTYNEIHHMNSERRISASSRLTRVQGVSVAL